MNEIISFPHLGPYHAPIARLLRYIFPHMEVRKAPPVTKRTMELGGRYSPDFVCAPFKYNLGNFIEALDGGATILIQAGGGCRYGYYGEVQEQILKDLGYDFKFVQFLAKEATPEGLYRICRDLGTPRSGRQLIGQLALTAEMLWAMDKIEAYVRENIGFAADKKGFEAAYGDFLRVLEDIDSFFALHTVYRDCRRKMQGLEVNKPDDCLRVGIVGELYSQMEPFSSFFIEKELAEKGIMVDRFIDLSYLLIKKPLQGGRALRRAGDYLRFHIGADGTGSVAKSKMLAERGYDGIIHLKPFGCTPEVNAMPMLQNISRDYKIPVLFFSFDSQTSETGIKTRLEAFHDMLLMRSEKGGSAQPCQASNTAYKRFQGGYKN